MTEYSERQRRGASAKPLSDEEIATLQTKYRELDIRRKRNATPKQRLVIWAICSVLAALLPMIAIIVSAIISKRPLGFYQVTAKGDMLVIAAVLMIAGFAELVPVFWRMPVGKEMNMFLIFIGMLFFAIADACWYGIILYGIPASGEPPGSASVAYGSLGMYVVAALLTSYCVWLSGSSE